LATQRKNKRKTWLWAGLTALVVVVVLGVVAAARERYGDRMTAKRTLVSSGSDFESAVGYSRAVRIGAHVVVAGTTGAGPAGDIAAQTRDALHRIDVDRLDEFSICILANQI